MNKNPGLISIKDSNILLCILIISTLICGSVFLIATYFYIAGSREYIDLLDRVFSPLFIALTFGALFMEIRFTYRAHKDLAELYPGYPISPGWAMAKLLIPVYSLFGIYQVYSTMAKFFKK